jgi:hypothetical protein
MKIISILCMVLASPVAAEKISLNEISSYFNAMTTGRGSVFANHGYGGNLYRAAVHSAARSHSF